jgi:hypothetical protein
MPCKLGTKQNIWQFPSQKYVYMHGRFSETGLAGTCCEIHMETKGLFLQVSWKMRLSSLSPSD